MPWLFSVEPQSDGPWYTPQDVCIASKFCASDLLAFVAIALPLEIFLWWLLRRPRLKKPTTKDVAVETSDTLRASEPLEGWVEGGMDGRARTEGEPGAGRVDRTENVCVLRWQPMEFGAWFVESTVSEPVSGWRERQGRGRPPLR